MVCLDKAEAAQGFEKLVRALTQVGLQTEVRNGGEESVLVFVKASDQRTKSVVFRSRYVQSDEENLSKKTGR